MAGEGIIGSWRRLNLVGRIAIGLAAAVCVALLTRWLGGGTEGWEATVARTGHVPEGWPAWVLSTGELLGDLFVGALKAVAPVLVFALVMAPLRSISGVRKPTSGRSSSCICWARSRLPWWR